MQDNAQSQNQHDHAAEPIWTRLGLVDIAIPRVCCLSSVASGCGLFTVAQAGAGVALSLPKSILVGFTVLFFGGVLGLLLDVHAGKRLAWQQWGGLGCVCLLVGVCLLVLRPWIMSEWNYRVCTREVPSVRLMERMNACEAAARSAREGYRSGSSCDILLKGCVSTLKHHTQPWMSIRACVPLLKHECEAELAEVCVQAAAYTSSCVRSSSKQNTTDEDCHLFKERLCASTSK